MSSSNFAPGRKWWLVKSNQETFKQFPNAVTIAEQLGMTDEVFFDNEFGLGERSGSRLDHLLYNSRIQQMYGKAWWITIKCELEDSGYGNDTSSPDKHLMNIVERPRLDKGIDRLRNQVVTGSTKPAAGKVTNTVTNPISPVNIRKVLSPSPVRAAKPSQCASDSKETALPNTTSASNEWCSKAPNTKSAYVSEGKGTALGGEAITNAFDLEASCLPIKPKGDTMKPLSADEAVVCTDTKKRSLEEVTASLDNVVKLLKSLRLDTSKVSNSAVKKKATHVAHEVVNIIKDCDQLVINSNTGSIPSSWIRIRQSKGGKSDKTVQRAKNAIKKAIAISTTEDETTKLNSIAETVNKGTIFEYKGGRKLIVTDKDDQLELQRSGGMTDRQMKAFNRLLARLTGFSIHETKNTLASLVNDEMVPFDILEQELEVNGAIKKVRSFVVKSICDAVSHRVLSLYNKDLLVPSSTITNLPDDTLMLRLGGDKGGSFMKTKFGATIMNCPTPNSMESFDLLATIDCNDTYFNLDQGIIKHYTDELALLCDDQNTPHVHVMAIPDEGGLCSFVSNKADFDFGDGEVLSMKPDPDSEGHSGPVLLDTGNAPLPSVRVCYDEDSKEAWGVAVLENADTDTPRHIVRFERPVSLRKAETLECTSFKLHTMFSGDIMYIHTILGLMTASSTYPCFNCLMHKNEIENGACHCPEHLLRTKENHKSNLKSVMDGTDTYKERKKKATSNGSVINPMLIPIPFAQIATPVLHILLGIVKKLWDNLIEDIQKIDHKDDPNRTHLRQLLCIITDHIEFLESLQKQHKNVTKDTEDRRKKACDLHMEEKRKAEPDANHLNSLSEEYSLALHEKKEAEAAKSAVDFSGLPALENIAGEIREHLSRKMGQGERALEHTIAESPISAKHNPFYGGSFNGNDCIRLVANHTLLFEALRNAYPNNEEVDAICKKHLPVFEAWSAVMPLLRASRKLDDLEQDELKENIGEFGKAHKEKIGNAFTKKMHHLLCHVAKFIDTYGTVGFFTEDALESIHARVNYFVARFASLDPERRVRQVVRSLASDKKSKMRRESRRKVNETTKKPTSRRQGRGGKKRSHTISAGDPVTEKVGAALNFYAEGGEDGTPMEKLPETGTDLCRQCGRYLQKDRAIPSCMMDLHEALCHVHNEDKSDKNKKIKRE